MNLERLTVARLSRRPMKTLPLVKVFAVLTVVVLAGCAYPIADDSGSEAHLSLEISGNISSNAIGEYEELSLSVFAIDESLILETAQSQYRDYVSAVFGGDSNLVDRPESSQSFSATTLITSSSTGSTKLSGLQPDDSYLVGLVATDPEGNGTPLFAAYERVSLSAGENDVAIEPLSDIATLTGNLNSEYDLGIDPPSAFSNLQLASDRFLVNFIQAGVAEIVIGSSEYLDAFSEGPQESITTDLIFFRIGISESSLDSSQDNESTTYTYETGQAAETLEPGQIGQAWVAKSFPFSVETSANPFNEAELVALTGLETAPETQTEEFQYETITQIELSITAGQPDPGEDFPPYDIAWSIVLNNDPGSTIEGELLGASLNNVPQ